MILSDRRVHGNESLLKFCYQSNPFRFESGVHGPGLTLPSSRYTNIASSVVACCPSNDWDRPHSESVYEKTSPSDALSENGSSEPLLLSVRCSSGIDHKIAVHELKQ